MSHIGTGVAAGVAQTQLQSKQVSQARNQRQAAANRQAKQVRDRYEAHLVALEDQEGGDSSMNLHVDSELPQHHSPPPDQPDGEREHRVVNEDEGDDTAESQLDIRA